jgi:hypothetical protein
MSKTNTLMEWEVEEEERMERLRIKKVIDEELKDAKIRSQVDIYDMNHVYLTGNARYISLESNYEQKLDIKLIFAHY